MQKQEEIKRKKEKVAQLRLQKQLKKGNQRVVGRSACQLAKKGKAEKATITKANREAKKQASSLSKESLTDGEGEDGWSSEQEVLKVTSRGRVLKKPSRFVY